MASTTTLATGLVPSLLLTTGRMLVDSHDKLVQPPSILASPKSRHRGVPFLPNPGHPSNATPSLSKLESLPVEIVDQILSYLIYPRCRLPGLTEAQSRYDVSEQQKRSIKNQEDLLLTSRPAMQHVQSTIRPAGHVWHCLPRSKSYRISKTVAAACSAEMYLLLRSVRQLSLSTGQTCHHGL